MSPEDMVDGDHSMADVALLIRRAGLEHLVRDPSADWVIALAEAGERLAKERAVLLSACLSDPAKAMAEYDGGAALRAETKRAAFMAAGEGG